jgi:hypothetical protein
LRSLRPLAKRAPENVKEGPSRMEGGAKWRYTGLAGCFQRIRKYKKYSALYRLKRRSAFMFSFGG